MLTVKGNDPPGTDRRRHSWPAWNNGYVSRFEPGCDCFCVNCNYTSLVRAETPGYYTVTAKHSKVIEEIKTGEVYDNVFRWRNNCYKYYVKDPYNDFRVKLKVYSGDPDIYVHPKNLPENIIQFKYNSLESMESEELVLSPKMRTDDGNIVGDYFICVQGKTTSSFKLELKNDDKTSFILESGVGEAGYLEKGEMVNYWYRDDILKSKTNVTFQLHAMSGSSTLRTKYCKATDDFEQTKSNCIHSIDELKKPIANEKVFNLIGSETIEHDPKDCNNVNPLLNLIRKSSPTCIYNIGIIGNSDGLNHYAVTVRHDEGHHVLLFEGKTFEGSLSQGDFDYYKISINDDKISKLTIQLLTVHGDPDLYVSTKDQFPSEAAFERRATICGRFPDTIEYTVGENNSTDLVGNYYVSVFGSQDSSYHLYYHTERLEQNEKGQEEKIKLPVKLNQGKPVLGVLKSKSDYLLYKFNIANITNEEEIIVQLLPQNGKFNFTVKNKGEATLTNFDKIGGFNNHYTVFFDPIKEPQFKNGEFNIYVYPIVTEDLDTSGMSFTFLINYFIGSHHITLLDGQQTMGFVKDEKINYYSYLFKNNINELKLTITKIIGNVNAVISLNQAILFPTENELSDTNGIFKATSEKTSFSKSRLSEFCANEDGKYCIMTVGVYSAVEAGKESQYVVTAKGVIPNVTPVLKVENGIPQHGYSLADEWQYYYYKTSNSTPAYAVVVPSVGNPNLYVSILSDLSLKESEWNKPTFTSNLKKSEDSVGADILLLTEKDLKNCSSSCVLIFGIVSEKANTNYTFTVTRGISILKENVAYTDSLSAEGNYNFYEYYRSCSGCTTVISISSFVQNPYNIYVNFNTTERFSKHENKNTADFSKSGRNSESLVISPEVLKLKGYKDEPGYFFIEVNSDSLLNYTITAISNDFKVFPLNKGIPSTYNIKDVNQQLYYSYLHESNNGFSIQVQEDFGFVELLINTAEESDSKISEKLPIDQEHSKWSTHQQSVRGEIEIKPDDKMFCFKCIYLIKIESKTASRGTISVQETGLQSNPNKITILKIGYPTTINIEPFGFTHCKFIVPDLSPINIDLNTLLGDVEYELTNTKVSEKNFGTFTDSNRNGTLIHYGKGLEESYIFNQQNKLFKTGSIYYLTIKSMTEYSKVILTLSHVGRYSAITESTPQKVRMDGSIKLFYYLVDPNPGKSKYIIEALPTNQKEKFTVFVKIASIPEENNPNEIDISPKWQISAEEIIKSKDYKIWFQNQQSKQNHISFDIEVVQSDLNKVVLLAVKSENEKPLGSTVNLYVASNNIQPLKLGVSHFGSVDNKDGIYKIYEAYIPKSQNETYVVELTPCQGKAEMFISKDIRRFNNKQYDSDSTKLTNGRLYAVLKSESESISKYIIVVKSLNNATNEYKSLETTQFKIEARRYPTLLAKKTYVEKYFVPNEGEIDWKVSDDGKYFDISWPRIYHKDLLILKFIFKFKFAQMNIKMHTICL